MISSRDGKRKISLLNTSFKVVRNDLKEAIMSSSVF